MAQTVARPPWILRLRAGWRFLLRCCRVSRRTAPADRRWTFFMCARPGRRGRPRHGPRRPPARERTWHLSRMRLPDDVAGVKPGFVICSKH